MINWCKVSIKEQCLIHANYNKKMNLLYPAGSNKKCVEQDIKQIKYNEAIERHKEKRIDANDKDFIGMG